MVKQNFLTKMLLLCALIVGSSSVWADDVLFYTLDGSDTSGGNSNYAQDGGGLTQDGIDWSVTGNTAINPWRIGGKNLDDVDREVYSKTPMGSAISKVELEIGGITLTVNSIKLIVASDASFSTVLQTINETPIEANSTLTFTPSSSEWATGAYYKFVFNVDAGGSNSYVQLKSAKFYKEGTVESVAVTFNTPSNGTLTIKNNGTAITSGDLVPTGTELTIEATPATGYSLTAWQYKTDGDWIDGEGTTYTVTSAVEFRAVFAEIPKFTVTLADDNTELVEASANGGVTLPTRDNVPGYTFAGWSNTELQTEATTATVIPVGIYYPTDDVTLYPLWKRTVGSTVETTSSVNISDYATANNWENSVKYHSVTIAGGITVDTNDKGTTGQYNSNDNTWRMYQASQNASEITVNAASGKQLKSVTFTYGVNNNGVMVYDETQIPSGTAVDLSGNSSNKFTIGNTGTATNGQVRITAISVTYITSSQDYFTSHPTTSVTATISTSGYTTFCSSFGLSFENVTAYVVSKSTNAVATLKRVTSVPAGTGVVLKGTPEAVVTIPVVEYTGADIFNLLVGTLEVTPVVPETVYVVSGGKFKIYDGTSIPANKAYLPLDAIEQIEQGAPSLSFEFDDETTGIQNIERTINDNQYYTLDGRRVAEPTKGIYIINGKKVVIK